MAKFDGIFTAQEKRASQPKTASPPLAPVASKPVGKRRDPAFTQTTAYVRRETHDAVMRAIYKRREYSELIEELLSNWLKEQK